MSTPARQALDRQATPWLFASALVTIALAAPASAA